MLRDPVYPDRYWNGICIVPTAQRWPHGIKGTGIKFDKDGKRWASRDAAMKAYAEYEITVALIYMKKASSNMDWDKLPSSLELVEVFVEVSVVQTTKLAVFQYAEFIAGHRVGSGENRTHMDVAMKALKHEAADSFKYMVRFKERGPNRTSATKNKAAELGIIAHYAPYPFMFLTNDADLMGAKLAFEGLRVWDFKTGRILD